MVIAADEAAMRALADTAPLFAPDVEVLTFPAWDCLPYDRASPALRVMAERLATLNALQDKRDKPQLLVATANAASQRLLTPFRIRQLTRRIAAGERIEREALVEQMNALGYQRADTVAEHGEYAVRGSLIDVFPAGEELALRLDFFGDEIELDPPLRPRRPALDRQGRGVHLDAGVGGAARRGDDQALPLGLSRAVRRHLDPGSALPGAVRRPPNGRNGALAAAARGQAFDPVRSPRRE